MLFGRPRAMASERLTASARRTALTATLLALTAGCGSPAGNSAGTSIAATRCGMTRTAANVPVNIQVEHGQVSCATALTVERDYARLIAAGKAPGNGGGGPVPIPGWPRPGVPTPPVLNTAQAAPGGPATDATPPHPP